MKDADDRLLEAMFAAEPIADNGFSDAVVRRIRRKLWTRRLCLATALVIGSSIALKPALAFTGLVVDLVQAVPGGMPGLSLESIPSTAMLVGGGLLFAITAIGLRLLED